MNKKKIALLSCACLIAALTVGEFVSRFVLGLGDPPLSVTHPTIEYMFKPSSEFHRFGNYFRTNEYGMRSGEFPKEREKNEIKILVLGDSVPNGGNLTDQNELATEILKENVRSLVSVPVQVGNISAGTWSPPNLLAYVEEFGTFDADVAVIILNKGDMFDFPTYAALNPKTHPTDKPISAFGELLSRYLAPRVLALLPSLGESAVQATPTDTERKNCTPELSELMELFTEEYIPVYLIYHPSEDEISPDGSFTPKGGYPVISEFSKGTLHSFASIYGESVRNGDYPYRDHYHPNTIGQKLMAEYLLNLFEQEGLITTWKERN